MDKFKKVSFGVMLCAMVGQVAYVKFGDEIEARFPVIKNVRDSMVSSAGGRGEVDAYALAGDGSAVDPRAYRKALMQDRKALASIGRESPRWRDVVERGTTDEFQAMMRKQWRKKEKEERERDKALRREADGSATHPWLYRKLWLSDAEKMATMRRDAPHMAATVEGEDIESFQEMLREMKRVEDGQALYGSGETPATMRVVGADGAAPRLGEPRIFFPPHPPPQPPR